MRLEFIRKKYFKFACGGALLLAAFCLLRAIFSSMVILPQTFRFGPLTIHYYGLTMALAVFLAYFLALKRAPKYGIEKKLAEDLIFWLCVGGFLGARLYHILSSFFYYQSHPLEMLQVWHGGLSIYGAVLGGVLALYLFIKIHNPPLPTLTLRWGRAADWLTPSLIVGQIVGRLGNFFNYEAYGLPTILPWKMFVPYEFRLENFVSYNFFHPWFLYEQSGNLVILLIILSLEKRKKQHLFVWYVLLYNMLRFVLEFLRADSVFVLGFRQNAIVSLCLCIGSILFLLHKHRKKMIF